MEKNPDACDYSKAQVSWRRKQQNGKASEMLARSFYSPTVLSRIVCTDLYLCFPGNPPGAGAANSRNGGTAGHSRREQKAAPAAPGGTAAEAAGGKQEQEEQQRFAALSDRGEGEAGGSSFHSNTSPEV